MSSLALVFIENFKECYTNGDTIGGKVHLYVDGSLDVSTIKVVLTATCETQITKDEKEVFTLDDNAKNKRVYETHTLLDKAVQVFPEPRLGRNKGYTLPHGMHFFDFSLQIPDKADGIACRTQKSLRHNEGFASGEPSFNQFTLPPSGEMDYKYGGHYSRITYGVAVRVAVKGLLSKDLKSMQPFSFMPLNKDLSYPLQQITRKSDRNLAFLPQADYGLATTQFKLNPFHLASKNVLSRLVGKKATNFDYAYQVRYLSESPINTPIGKTGRIITIGSNLLDICSLHMVSALSYDDFAEKLRYNRGYQGNEAFVISQLEISLLQRNIVRVKGNVRSWIVKIGLKTHAGLNHTIKLTSFDDIEHTRLNKFEGCPLKGYASQYNAIREFNLARELLDVTIPEVPTSFVTCNAKREYELRFDVTAYSKDYPNEISTVKFTSPITVVHDPDAPIPGNDVIIQRPPRIVMDGFSIDIPFLPQVPGLLEIAQNNGQPGVPNFYRHDNLRGSHPNLPPQGEKENPNGIKRPSQPMPPPLYDTSQQSFETAPPSLPERRSTVISGKVGEINPGNEIEGNGSGLGSGSFETAAMISQSLAELNTDDPEVHDEPHPPYAEIDPNSSEQTDIQGQR